MANKFQYTPGSLLLKQTRATDLPLEHAPSYQTSLKWGSKTREQKFCCATYFFTRNRWCRRGSFAPGACCRGVLREQAPSCVPAFKITKICFLKILNYAHFFNRQIRHPVKQLKFWHFERRNVSEKPGIIFGLFISYEYWCSQNHDNHNTNLPENNKQVPVTRLSKATWKCLLHLISSVFELKLW